MLLIYLVLFVVYCAPTTVQHATSKVSSEIGSIAKDYAFGDLDSGAFHVGVASFDAAGERESVASVGYSRRGGDDFDYSIAVLDTEEGSTLQLTFRTKLGITLDLMTTDGDTLYGIGYSWKVGN